MMKPALFFDYRVNLYFDAETGQYIYYNREDLIDIFSADAINVVRGR